MPPEPAGRSISKRSAKTAPALSTVMVAPGSRDRGASPTITMKWYARGRDAVQSAAWLDHDHAVDADDRPRPAFEVPRRWGTGARAPPRLLRRSSLLRADPARRRADRARPRSRGARRRARSGDVTEARADRPRRRPLPRDRP